MRAISAEVPHGDGAGVFNNVYLRVTEMVANRLKTTGVFHDERSLPTSMCGSPATGSPRTTQHE
jgi:hypothetical protein